MLRPTDIRKSSETLRTPRNRSLAQGAPIVDVKSVLGMPDVRKRLEDFGLEVNPSSPQELRDEIKADVQKWRKVVKTQNITVQ